MGGTGKEFFATSGYGCLTMFSSCPVPIPIPVLVLVIGEMRCARLACFAPVEVDGFVPPFTISFSFFDIVTLRLTTCLDHIQIIFDLQYRSSVSRIFLRSSRRQSSAQVQLLNIEGFGVKQPRQ